MRQGGVETVTHGREEESLLAKHLNRILASADSMQIDVRVRLASIPSVDKALRELGTFYFVVSHLFSAGGRHSSSLLEIFRLIERL